jgi:hypothetical protein
MNKQKPNKEAKAKINIARFFRHDSLLKTIRLVLFFFLLINHKFARRLPLGTSLSNRCIYR